MSKTNHTAFTIVLQESKIAVLKNMAFYDKILLYWGHCLPAVNIPAQHFSQPEKNIYFSGGIKMEIKTTKNDGKMTAAVSGRIDIITVPELEQWFYKEVEGVKKACARSQRGRVSFKRRSSRYLRGL